jgi:small GTP-binding protein
LNETCLQVVAAMGIKSTKNFDALDEANETRILMVGLDAAGKTTTLYRLKLGEVVVTAPTIGFNVESVQVRNMNVSVWDIASQNNKIRPLWRHYFHGVKGLIFVVDSTDLERIELARVELENMLQEKKLRNVKLLVLANKQDLQNALPTDEVTTKLGLQNLKRTHWKVLPSSAVDGTGIFEGLDWMVSELNAL